MLGVLAYKTIAKKIKENKNQKLHEMRERTKEIAGVFYREDPKGVKTAIEIDIKLAAEESPVSNPIQK
jgi:uncharacterized lipoprotein YehR (DUF1307 family)